MRLFVTVSLLLCALTAHGSAPDCTPGRYHKSLLVTGFRLPEPQSARVGQLHRVETGLPRQIARRLEKLGPRVQTQTNLLLDNPNRLLKGYYERYDAVQHAARQYQTQFVLSGRIDDMAMRYPQRYFGQTPVSGLGNWFRGRDNDMRSRHFALRLTLYEALTGRLILRRLYQATGLWDAPYGQATGFATPRFWATDYGQQIDALIDDAAHEMARLLACQPFHTPLKATGQNRIVYLQAGAHQGLANGDTLRVYEHDRANFTDIEYNSTRTLTPRVYSHFEPLDIEVVIQQVHPDYSVGRFSGPLPPHRAYLAIDDTPGVTPRPQPRPAPQPETSGQNRSTPDRQVPPR